MKSLADVNFMAPKEFVVTFGDVAEHSPWVAEAAAEARPFASREAMIAAFETALRRAGYDYQLALIRAHPDLAGKAKLTEDSTREQSRAGLNSLNPDEFARFTQLNREYKQKFGFPFIFAVKGATKHQILASFSERIGKNTTDEFATALTEVCQIFRFRIEDRVAP